MVIKQNSDHVQTFVDAEVWGNEDDLKTFVQLVFLSESKTIEFTFHSDEERQELLIQLQNIINNLRAFSFEEGTDALKPNITVKW